MTYKRRMDDEMLKGLNIRLAAYRLGGSSV